ILEDVGLGSFQKWMSKFQISTKIANDLTVALGSSSMKLIELARSYAIFANGGYWVEPNFILSVKNESGEEIWEKSTNSKPRVMDANTAGILTDMLRGVIQTGTGRA